MDIKSILAAAKDQAGGDLAASSYDNSWRPPENSYRARVVQTNHGKTKKGNDPRIGVWLEIVEGPESGKRWWDNITLFADNPQASAINFGKLLAMGVDERTIEALNDVAAIAPLLDSWEGMVKVVHKANPNNPDDPYINTYFLADEAAPAAPADTPADSGEEKTYRSF